MFISNKQYLRVMGNQQDTKKKENNPQKIILRLRYRDIIIHYSFKMKLTIGDVDLFPSGFDGLRIWDTDIVLSRFIILEN